MARHLYVPALSRPLVRALHFEARHRRQPMSRLLAGIVADALRDRPGWRVMEAMEAGEREDTGSKVYEVPVTPQPTPANP